MCVMRWIKGKGLCGVGDIHVFALLPVCCRRRCGCRRCFSLLRVTALVSRYMHTYMGLAGASFFLRAIMRRLSRMLLLDEEDVVSERVKDCDTFTSRPRKSAMVRPNPLILQH
jgi:hypothetical protein